ncbi:putative leucine-rich repeat-containing protein DDB_G0290503 [Onthophagus taurus]|uniref:putative leucine-rich repeat-containing protein DDB_G0290503 n=1 Tax=Onthophagus taurus TaxID=166361 RepID=UPI0039BE5C01
MQNQSSSDVVNQEIYDLKREVARLTLLEKDYIAEIEGLQMRLAKNNKDWEKRVDGLEEEKRAMELAKTEALEEVEAALQAKSEQLKVLTAQIESMSKRGSVVEDSDEMQSLLQKVQELELEISKLKEENSVMRESALNLENDIHIYEESMNNLKNDFNILSENYQRKSDELQESKKLADTLQEDLMMAKTELDVLKSKPDSSSGQGNSLFAEVEEKRVELQGKVNRMKNHYDEMKQQISRLENQVFKMRVENGTLQQNWEKEIEDRNNDRLDLEDSYKVRINVLESLIAEYKKELDSRPLIAVKALKDEELSLIEYRIDMKNKQINNLLEKYDRTSLSNMLLVDRNREVMRESSSWHLRFVKIQEELDVKEETITKLKEQIKELQESYETLIVKEKPDDSPAQSPVLVPCINYMSDKNIDLSRLMKRSASLVKSKNCVKEEDKENDVFQKKQVQFSSDTKNFQNKGKIFRQGGKVTIENTVLKKKEFIKKEF